MEAVSRLLAGGLLSGPGIRLVTAGMVCYVWLVCFRSARAGEGTTTLCASWSVVLYSLGTDFSILAFRWDELKFCEILKPKMNNYCPHATGYL